VPERTLQALFLAVETTPQQPGHAALWRRTRMLAIATTAAAAAVLTLAALGPFDLLQSTVVPGGPTVPPTLCPSPLASGSIATIAGTGETAADGDGGQATDASIDPSGAGLAVDEDGNVFFSEGVNGSIRRIGTDGIITTVADVSTGADFIFPNGLAFDPSGVLHVSDLEGARIWRVEDDGSTTAVVGTGVHGSAGNDGPALEALVQPAGLAIGPNGDLYFDDLNNFRRVEADGTIHAFAGSTEAGFGGDGGPATEAAFGTAVMGTAVDELGNVYLGDPGNRRIRRVDPEGVVTTFAGTSTFGPRVDGVPALEATLTSSPFGIAVDDGSVYFSEWQTSSVHRVDPSGIITTVAGGRYGDSGDCGLATEAGLAAPGGIAIHDGVLYIVDGGNDRIRVVVL
jgi:sugar lactone lactonase YvrE